MIPLVGCFWGGLALLALGLARPGTPALVPLGGILAFAGITIGPFLLAG